VHPQQVKEEQRSRDFLTQEILRIQKWMVSRSKEWLNPCELKNDDDVLSVASYLSEKWEIDCAVLEALEAADESVSLLSELKQLDEELENAKPDEEKRFEKEHTALAEKIRANEHAIIRRQRKIEKCRSNLRQKVESCSRAMDLAGIAPDDPIRSDVPASIVCWLDSELDGVDGRVRLWSYKLKSRPCAPADQANVSLLLTYFDQISEEVQYARLVQRLTDDIDKAVIWVRDAGAYEFFNIPEFQSLPFFRKLKEEKEAEQAAAKLPSAVFDSSVNQMLSERHLLSQKIAGIRQWIGLHSSSILGAMDCLGVPTTDILRRNLHPARIIAGKALDTVQGERPLRSTVQSERAQAEERFKSFAGHWWSKTMAAHGPCGKKICSDDDLLRMGREFDAQGFAPSDHYFKKFKTWKQIRYHNQSHQRSTIQTYPELAAFLTRKGSPGDRKTDRGEMRREFGKLLSRLANPRPKTRT
jgi:hypothetical protein